MSGQKKGFDPLSRLFDPPTPPRRRPLPALESPTGDPRPIPPMDPTDLDDPRPKGPPSLVMPPPSLAPAPSEELLPDVPSDEVSKPAVPAVAPKSAPVAEEAAPPTPTLVPQPEEPKAPAVDPKDLAKMLAKAAAARGKAPRSPGAEAQRAPAPAPAAPSESRPPISRLAAAPPPTRSRPAAEVVAEGSRLAAAPPPMRKKSASEVLDELARQPEPEPVASAPSAAAPAEPAPRAAIKPATIQLPPPSPRAESEWVAPLLMQQLPALAGAGVPKVLLVEDREVQKALWKGHRARFLATGDVGHGLAASAVLHALNTAEAGDLAVARLVAGDRDWLVWVERRSCIAAFPNASLWFNGL